MQKILSKTIATLYITTLVFGFVHVFLMSVEIHTSCPHQKDDHALCKSAIGENLGEIKNTFLYLLLGLALFVYSYRHDNHLSQKKNLSPTKTNIQPMPIQRLYSAGILNSKAP